MGSTLGLVPTVIPESKDLLRITRSPGPGSSPPPRPTPLWSTESPRPTPTPPSDVDPGNTPLDVDGSLRSYRGLGNGSIIPPVLVRKYELREEKRSSPRPGFGTPSSKSKTTRVTTHLEGTEEMTYIKS